MSYAWQNGQTNRQTDRQTGKPTNEHTCQNCKFWQVMTQRLHNCLHRCLLDVITCSCSAHSVAQVKLDVYCQVCPVSIAGFGSAIHQGVMMIKSHGGLLHFTDHLRVEAAGSAASTHRRSLMWHFAAYMLEEFKPAVYLAGEIRCVINHTELRCHPAQLIACIVYISKPLHQSNSIYATRVWVGNKAA